MYMKYYSLYLLEKLMLFIVMLYFNFKVIKVHYRKKNLKLENLSKQSLTSLPRFLEI